MNKIEIALNILHYCMYVLRYKFHLAFNKINPGNLLLKTSFIKMRYKEQGINPEDVRKAIDMTFGDKRFGYSVIVSGGALWSSMFTVFFSIFFIIQGFFPQMKQSLPLYMVLGVLAYLISHLFVFRKDKYLRHFRKFEKWTNQERKKYLLLTFFYLVFVPLFFFFSLWINSKIRRM